MTAANLAVIFGPNLLQRERGADASAHIYAMGIEDSTAIISVTLVLIQNYKRLFTVWWQQLSYSLNQAIMIASMHGNTTLINSCMQPFRFLQRYNRKS